MRVSVCVILPRLLNLLPVSPKLKELHFEAIYICAAGGKENLVLQPVGLNKGDGIVIILTRSGRRLYVVQTTRGESFEGHISKSIEGC
jgi:hypothetical protein